MPPLPNTRHERYAQELATGKTADEAYQLAGFTANRGNASRLKANENIIARVTELQERGAKRAEVTVISLLEEAEAARLLAMDIKAPAAAIAAVREKGILSGKRVERSEHGDPGDFELLDDPALLRERLIAEATALGEGHVAAALAGGKRRAGEQLN